MAVVTVRSQLITNIVNSPPIQNPVTQENARKRASAAVVTLNTTDSVGSIYKLARVMSHWRMINLRLFNAALTAGNASIGLYRTDADGGAAVAVACYGNAVSLAAANLTGIEQAYAVRTLDKMVSLVWQDAGTYALDPKLALDLCLTLTTAVTVAGLVAMDLNFCVD